MEFEKMSFIASVESKLEEFDTEITKAFTAVEPELQTLARSEGAKLLGDVTAELPALIAAESPTLMAVGFSTPQITAIGAALGAALAKGIAKAGSTPAAAAPVSATAPTSTAKK
jgi:hypothetical protein